MRIAGLALLSLLLTACGVGSPARPGGTVGDDPAVDQPEVLIVAHRGYSGVAPENTNTAVDLGAASGAEYVEIDVQMASDGGLVVMHDTTLSRTTNAPLAYPARAPWNVGDFTLDEMRGLDGGTWYGFSRDPGNFNYVGEPVPDLRTILDTLRDRAGLLLEVKSPDLYPGIEAAIAAELESAGWVMNGQPTQPLIVQSFDWGSMATYAALHPDVPIGLLGNPPSEDAVWNDISRYADAINPSHSNVDQATVDEIHRRGFEVSVYTVNDTTRAAELIAMGVDGIITDQPARLLLERDRELPPSGAFELGNPEITELSGLAQSTRTPGVFWALNDSGDAARVFAFDRLGRSLGEAAVRPAFNLDWEDMASYATDDGHFLLMADVGDNDAIRPFVNLYIAPEPELMPATGSLAVSTELTVVYPDGARDCEGVAVDAEEQAVYLLSKRDPLPRLYRVPLDATPVLPTTAEYLGEITSLPLPNTGQLEPAGSITNVSPTGFSISADGRHALIVTLEHSYRYTRQAGQTWLDALNTTPEVINVPDYAQIESGEFIGTGPAFLIGSEGSPAPMFATSP